MANAVAGGSRRASGSVVADGSSDWPIACNCCQSLAAIAIAQTCDRAQSSHPKHKPQASIHALPSNIFLLFSSFVQFTVFYFFTLPANVKSWHGSLAT